ncbi:MAG TPA: tetratricopeptide repeat protein, partial [Rhodanobacteraceae bacterium]|nr:tetratricopeptide repeat protein [Rhodanobacteraceae bacterium]
MKEGSTDVFVERLWQRAQRYIVDEQFGAARAVLETLLSRVPRDLQARLLLSSVLLKLGLLRDACAHLLLVARQLPDDAATIQRVAYCLHQVGETAAMRDCLVHRAIEGSRDPGLLLALAQLHQLLGAHEHAL